MTTIQFFVQLKKGTQTVLIWTWQNNSNEAMNLKQMQSETK